MSQEILGAQEERYARAIIAPYYNAKYGNWLRPILDNLIADVKSKRLEYKLRTIDFEKAARTLQLQVCQAWQWLIDHVDKLEDRRYFLLREQITVFKVKNSKNDPDGGGVLLAWKGGDRIVGEPVAVESRNFKWRRDFEKYLEEAGELSVYERQNVNMTADDLEWVESQIICLPDFVMLSHSVTGFKVVKDTTVGDQRRRLGLVEEEQEPTHAKKASNESGTTPDGTASEQ